MTYSVKEMFLTVQGEGAQAGRAAVFLRFSGCNLWSGREPDRAGAACDFCDTDFIGTDGPGGGKFAGADALAESVAAKWPGLRRPRSEDSEEAASASQAAGGGAKLVVCTGGEPALQLDAPLIDALHKRGFEIAIETNGTLPAPAGVDWICVSPKGATQIVQTRGDELKLVYPQKDAPPERFEALDFRIFSLQPMDGPDRAANEQAAYRYCLAHPRWRLSLQTHKYLGVP